MTNHKDRENTSSSSIYPQGFSCELVVQSPVKDAKIMMKIESFYIPSNSDDCVENYMYVFDSNTAKTKAMPEAGGERGLCRSAYPRFPVFTTNACICIAFHTSIHRAPFVSNQKPGFRVVLTAIRDTTTTTCPPNSFYCGPRPAPVLNQLDIASQLYLDRRPYGGGSSSLSMSGSATSMRRDSSPGTSVQQQQQQQPHTLGYCIADQTLCDGISNCADGLDESSSRCSKVDSVSGDWMDGDTSSNRWISGFLSLGIPASIAIAVSTIIIFTVCIGAVICCCTRCCKVSMRSMPYPRISRFPPDRSVAFGNSMGAYGRPTNFASATASAQLGHHPSSDQTNLASWLNGSRQLPVTPYNQQPATYAQYYSKAGHLYPAPHFLDTNRSDHFRNEQPRLQRDLLMCPGTKVPYSDDKSPAASSTEEPPKRQHKALSAHTGSDSYASVHANPTRIYTGYSAQPGHTVGPPNGQMSSPSVYRSDQSGIDPCCYTPPPYGACTVPPASSVTASSSRTGTTSGGGMMPNPSNEVGWSRRSRLPDNLRFVTSGSTDAVVTATGSIQPSDLCGTGSNGMLFGQQHSGGGNSALHTNTPVETASQSGGDLVSNGGIVYLGEVFQPFSDGTADKFRVASCSSSGGGGGVICAGSTTTGSGSSNGRRSHAHRLLQQQHQAGRTKADSTSHRRPRAPSHRQHRYRYHRSADAPRTLSSSSQTPASSRSGLPPFQRSAADTATSLYAADPEVNANPDESFRFPIQL
ncbi:hypothetical protein P879_07024 [Paragonimus westermani]|uniref:CUB domain-containing protein n=1 Tax=Paragonimus westermani TaxID=34504 RepID=A0A8T0D3E2_9TREM|nr:hypothetical protein P879_07024 [Paragonimus westermani]